MTSSCFRLLLVLMPLWMLAQSPSYLVQPSLNIAYSPVPRVSLNTVVSQRNLIENGWNSLHVQAAQFISYEVGFYSQIGVGFMYRELDGSNTIAEKRLTQQYVYSRKYNALKVAHRLRWDQRFRENTTHRWRYRLSSSIPLNGTKTDSREYYATGSLETLFIANATTRPAYDQRLSLGIGRKINSRLKAQIVLQYRWEDLTQATNQLLFTNLAVYYKL